MTTPSSLPPSELDQPELAFAAMAQRLAGLTAAVDGFAARQQELHGRDYGPDLEKVRESFEAVRGAIYKLADKPALTLEPKDVAEQMDVAGREGRQADHYAWDKAQGRLESAARSIEKVVASALAFKVQRYWIAGSAAAALMVGIVLTYCAEGSIDRAVPESWHWPEANAAKMLGRDEWEAGIRLLQTANPQGWQTVAQALPIIRNNAQKLADCETRAAKVKTTIACTIEINGESQAVDL